MLTGTRGFAPALRSHKRRDQMVVFPDKSAPRNLLKSEQRTAKSSRLCVGAPLTFRSSSRARARARSGWTCCGRVESCIYSGLTVFFCCCCRSVRSRSVKRRSFLWL